MRKLGDYPKLTEKSALEQLTFVRARRGKERNLVNGRLMQLGVNAMLRAVHLSVRSAMTATHGPTMAEKKALEAADTALAELVERLNGYQPDSNDHVTAEQLRGAGGSYSLEAYALAMALAAEIAGSPRFHYTSGTDLLRVAGALLPPLSVKAAFKSVRRWRDRLLPHNVQVVEADANQAVVRWQPSGRERQMMGQYFQHYIYMTCQAYQGAFAAAPTAVHGLAPASVHERACVLDGDDYCEWEFSWPDAPPSGLLPAGGAALVALVMIVFGIGWAQGALRSTLLALAPLVVTLGYLVRTLRRLRFQQREQAVQLVEQQAYTDAQVGEMLQTREWLQKSNADLRRRVTELAALQEFATHIVLDLEADTSIDSALDLLITRLGYDRALLALCGGDPPVLRPVRWRVASFLEDNDLSRQTEDYLRALSIPLENGQSALVRVATSGQTETVLPYGSSTSDADKQFVAAMQTGGMLLVPVTAGEEVRGVLGVDYVTSGQGLSEADEGILTTVANTLAVTLQNAYLYARTDAELAARVEELSILTEIDTQLNRSMDLVSVLKLTLDWAARYVHATAGSIGLVDYQTNVLRLMASQGYSEEYRTGGTWPVQLSLEKGIVGQVMGTGRSAMAEDVQLLDGYVAMSPTTLSQIGVPIPVEGRVAGLILLEKDVVDDFTDEELTFTRRIAERAAIAIENARLFGAAQREREQLDTILASATDAVIVADYNEYVVLMNPAARVAFGVALFDDLTGRLLRDVLTGRMALEVAAAGPVEGVERGVEVTPLDVHPLLDLLAQVKEGHGSQTAEVPTHDGRTFTTSVSEVSGVGWVFVMHDITYLKELDELKSELLATVSHDLKQPLTAIKGYMDLLAFQNLVSDEGKPFAERVVRAASDMRRLIDELLDLAHIESGMELALASVDLRQLITEAVEDLQEAAQEKSITLSLDLPDGLPRARADFSRISQVMNNLVGNAIKYTPDDGHVVVRAVPNKSYVTISVQDDGYGIGPGDLTHIFDKFYRVRTEETADIEGTGLGLSIVKGLVEEHGGEINVTSEPGEGSTFTFTLPLEGETEGSYLST